MSEFKIISAEAVPSRGHVASGLYAELYRAIGRMEVTQAIEISKKDVDIDRLYSALTSYYSFKKKSNKDLGFTVTLRRVKNSPQPGYSTMYIKKKINE